MRVTEGLEKKRQDLVNREHWKFNNYTEEYTWQDFVDAVNDIDEGYGDNSDIGRGERLNPKPSEDEPSTMLHNPDPDFEVPSEFRSMDIMHGDKGVYYRWSDLSQTYERVDTRVHNPDSDDDIRDTITRGKITKERDKEITDDKEFKLRETVQKLYSRFTTGDIDFNELVGHLNDIQYEDMTNEEEPLGTIRDQINKVKAEKGKSIHQRFMVNLNEAATKFNEEAGKIMRRKDKGQAQDEWMASQAKEHIERPEFDGNVLDDLDHVNAGVKAFWLLTERMVVLYSRKNKDYGNSFDASLDDNGLLVTVIRLEDKMNRFKQLAKSSEDERAVMDESIKDTLIDISNYAMMTIKWLEENE